MNIEERKAFNHLIYMDERIIVLLKSFENQGENSEKQESDLHPSGSKPGVQYGLRSSIRSSGCNTIHSPNCVSNRKTYLQFS